VGQALTNVLKNAVEAVDQRFGAPIVGKRGEGQITVRLVHNDAEIAVYVIDNGVGLPQAERDRLTEPYVTTRAKEQDLALPLSKRFLRTMPVA